MNIYVSNLGYGTSEDQVRDAFNTFGEVESVKLIKDQLTGRLKGFGFVEMPDTTEAQTAIRELNNSRLDSQVITVNQARPKTSDSGYGSNRGAYHGSNDRRY